MYYGVEVCDYLLLVDVDMNMVDGYVMFGWDCGYGDMVLCFDVVMLCWIFWLVGMVLVIVDFVWGNGELVGFLFWVILDC